MRVLCKTILSLIVMLFMLTATFVAVSLIIQENSIVNKISVAVVIPDNDLTTKIVAQYIAKMDSVESIADFEYIQTKEEGLSKLESKDVSAIIALPNDFYNDVNDGYNTPVDVYINHDSNYFTRTFARLISSAVNDVQISEAVVYSFIEASYGEVTVKHHPVGDYIAEILAKIILKRNKTFENVIVSEYGEISAYQYYSFALIIVLMLLMGINCSYLYKGENISLEAKLKVYGLGVFKQSLTKTAIMSLYIFLIGIFSYISIYIVSILNDIETVYLDLSSIISIALISVSIAGIFHAVYSWVNSEYMSGIIMIMAIIIIVLVSGIVIPFSRLSNVYVYISYLTPLRYISDFGINGLFNKFSYSSLLILLFIIIAEQLIGVLGLCKRY